jgi:histidinol-phosphate/aromatic aminotransferase/cobyric acid decarboxylase-like protein
VLPAAGEHGGDAAAVARALGLDPTSMLDLSVNLNPVAPDVTAIVAAHASAVRTYPDPAVAEAALAERIGREVLLTNGGAEAIALVAGHLGAVAIDEPEFSLWRRHARIEPGAPRACSNPNNPTGLLAADDERAAVWDEAFFPLATGAWTRGDDAIVVGSLTKVLSCPGLRVGYVAGDVGALRELQPQWSVNGLACAALPELLDLIDLPAWTRAIASLRDDLVAVLRDAGLDPRPSDAPWVLVDVPLRERLAPRGVVVRDCTSFGLPGVTRIAVPDEDGLERLEEALREVEARGEDLRHG